MSNLLNETKQVKYYQFRLSLNAFFIFGEDTSHSLLDGKYVCLRCFDLFLLFLIFLLECYFFSSTTFDQCMQTNHFHRWTMIFHSHHLKMYHSHSICFDNYSSPLNSLKMYGLSLY